MTADGAAGTLHLHIGLPKTASTWLQSRVFPALTHLDYAGIPHGRLFDEPADREGRLMTGVLRRAPALWASVGEAVMDEMLAGIAGGGYGAGRDVLVSDEAIGRAASRPEVLAAHLRAMARAAGRRGLGRMRVIALVRRQDLWLASHYAQMSDRNPRASQRDFEALLRRVADPAGARFGFGMLLDYEALRAAFEEAGIALRIMPHEALTRDPRGALARLLAWLDTPPDAAARIADEALGTFENARSEGCAWRLRPRRLSLPGGRGLALPAALGRGSIRLTPELSAAVLGAYAGANRALEAACPMGLAAHGYLGRSAEPSRSCA